MGERDLVITVVDLYAGEVLGTTTCFDPICWPSSGCTLIFRAIIQHVVGILGVCGGGGRRSRYYGSGLVCWGGVENTYMFRPYMLAIVSLYFNFSSNHTTCGGYSGGVGSGGMRSRSPTPHIPRIPTTCCIISLKVKV